MCRVKRVVASEVHRGRSSGRAGRHFEVVSAAVFYSRRACFHDLKIVAFSALRDWTGRALLVTVRGPVPGTRSRSVESVPDARLGGVEGAGICRANGPFVLWPRGVRSQATASDFELTFTLFNSKADLENAGRDPCRTLTAEDSERDHGEGNF